MSAETNPGAPQWEQMYQERPVESMPWFNPEQNNPGKKWTSLLMV